MRINLIGLGKLGYPMSLFLSSSGHKINCYDKDNTIYEKIKNSSYLTNEENLGDYKKFRNNLFYFDNIQSSFEGTFISFITVPTPSKLDGSFSLDAIMLILDQIGIYLRKNKENNQPYLVNICSTVNPYSCENELIPYLENKYDLKEGVDFVLVYNPYFVALGSVVKILQNPDFVLIGSRSKVNIKNLLDIYYIMYSRNVKFKILTLTEAEIVKIFVNTFLTFKVSFSNFVGLISIQDKELSAKKILDAIGEDNRIGKSFLQPGFPYGGPCLPRDNYALENFAGKLNIESPLNKSSEIINNNYTLALFGQIDYLVKNYALENFAGKLNIESPLNKSSEIINNNYTLALFGQIDYLVKNNIKKISFIGLGYRSNTECVEGSVSLKLIDYCIENNLEVLLYDFYINHNYKNLKKYSILEDFLLNSDIIFLPYKDKKFNQLLDFDKKRLILLDFFSQFDHNNNNNNIITNNLKRVDLDLIKTDYAKKTSSKIVDFKKKY